jgi:hypothetical protein
METVVRWSPNLLTHNPFRSLARGCGEPRPATFGQTLRPKISWAEQVHDTISKSWLRQPDKTETVYITEGEAYPPQFTLTPQSQMF